MLRAGYNICVLRLYHVNFHTSVGKAIALNLERLGEEVPILPLLVLVDLQLGEAN